MENGAKIMGKGKIFAKKIGKIAKSIYIPNSILFDNDAKERLKDLEL